MSKVTYTLSPDNVTVRVITKEEIDRMETRNLLIFVRPKGAAWQSTDLVDRVMHRLKPRLTGQEHFDLHLGLVHYRLGEGAAEFYDVVNGLIKKYSEKPNSHE